MDLRCQHKFSYYSYCDQPAWVDRTYCKWHKITHDFDHSSLSPWRKFMGHLFDVFAFAYGISFVVELWQFITSGQFSPLSIYATIAGVGYFSSLAVLLLKRSSRILWPKIFIFSLGMYSIFYLAYTLFLPSDGGVFNVLAAFFGLGCILLVFSATLFTPLDRNRAIIYVAVGILLIAIAFQTIQWVAIVLLAILILFLSDIEYEWTKKLRSVKY